MGKIKKEFVEQENFSEEHPLVVKKETKRSNGNGYIPVKYDYAELWFSTSENAYFAIFKIEGKKYRFEMVK